jgi:membrane protein DedA with SNARE-associated domain
MDFGGTPTTYLMMSLALVVFGILYDQLVSWMERHSWSRGGTSLLVVCGTLVTLAAGSVVIGIDDALLVPGLFAASGTPMIVGSLVRYILARAENERQVAEMAKRLLLEERDSHDSETSDR